MIKFVSIKDDLPPYGAPVILSINGTVQHITYCLDGADECPDWFEPYYFEHDDIQKLTWNKADRWALMPDWND